MNTPITIGLIGFGVVGEGVYHALENQPASGFPVKTILIRDSEKPRNAPPQLFTTDPEALLADPEIDVVIELIDDAQAAFDLVIRAMQHGKHVISANKKMIAGNLDALLRCRQQHGVSFLYEAAVGGSLPIIRALEETYALDPVQACQGILNGSTNYILTQRSELGLTYAQALLQAQQAGFAESDPRLDVEGLDAQNKICILLKHAFGLNASPEAVFTRGITQIGQADYDLAKAQGWEIRLLATAFRVSGQEVAAYVLPHFVPQHDFLGRVRQEENAMIFRSRWAGRQHLSGKGAGRFPTASAVLSDLRTLRLGGNYHYPGSKASTPQRLCHDHRLQVYIRFEDGYGDILPLPETTKRHQNA